MVFFENYVISTINEGEVVSQEKSNLQTQVLMDHFKDRPFVYITHRINSYSVDPTIYFETSKFSALAGFVVVSKEKPGIKNAIYEKAFLNKPFEIFEDLEDAILWADNLCNMKKKLGY